VRAESGPETSYVALGDSISIDDHAGRPERGGASLLHANRDDDFPEWRGSDLRTERPGTGFAPLCTDGATTRTLLEVQLPRLAALPPPSVVTLRSAATTCWAPTGTPPRRGG
jgi:hypothetical protein